MRFAEGLAAPEWQYSSNALLGKSTSVAIVRSVWARAVLGFSALAQPLVQSDNMDSNGTCAKVAALLQFDAGRGDMSWIALQRWTGVAASHVTYYDRQAPELPRNIRYCRGDPEKGAQIARDVASMPRRPPPGPGQLPTKHGMHSGKAIRNVRLSRSEARMPHGNRASVPPTHKLPQ